MSEGDESELHGNDTITIMHTQRCVATVARTVVCMSKVWAAALQLDPSAHIVPACKHIDVAILRLVLDWMIERSQRPSTSTVKSEQFENLQCVLDPYDFSFVNRLSVEQVLFVMITANYLDIPVLYRVACAKIAYMIMTCDTATLNELFGM